MTETVNQESSSAAAEPQAERTFTQSEMNAIIQDRLTRERSKYADYDALKATAERADALQKQVDALTKANSIRELRSKVSAETGVPAELLNGETEEACKAQAQAILKFAKPSGYPTVKDGGDPAKKMTGSTSEQFAAWFEQAMK